MLHDPKVPNYGSIYIGLPSLKQIETLSLDDYWKRGKLLRNVLDPRGCGQRRII